MIVRMVIINLIVLSWFTICESFLTNLHAPCSHLRPSFTSLFASDLDGTYRGSSNVRSLKTSKVDAPFLQMISFYRFSSIEDPESVRDDIFEALSKIKDLRGTVYLAKEGINAQLAVPVSDLHNGALEDTIAIFKSLLPFDPFELNDLNLGDTVDSDTPTFNRLIVRTRNQILRDGLDDDLDWSDAGSEVSPKVWHEEIRERNASQNGLFLDCRNSYESEKGIFDGADPLGTNVFSESWEELESRTDGVDRDEPIHIFCTGGIRCVKVGAFLKQKLGFKNVRRLEHGIVGYQRWAQEGLPEKDSSVWHGENFMFDKRRFEVSDEKSSNDV
mmetsp:Transcript_26907/g.41210  ORF Transcript_26907/g.41210 Transcript_26907/m.41210 type:complete len:330 (-) Transcript_26907:172-1161(-)